MKRLVTLYGVLSAVCFVGHCTFWWAFDWPASLQSLTEFNRMLMQALCVCLLPFFAFSAYAFLVLWDSILDSRLGRAVLVMNAAVYLLRATAEPVFGNFPTGVPFFVFCVALGAIFLIPLVSRPREPAGRPNQALPAKRPQTT